MTPIIFLTLVTALLTLLALNNPWQALLGLGLVAAALPVFQLIQRATPSGAGDLVMTWIRVVPFDDDEKLRAARAAQQALYPIE